MIIQKQIHLRYKVAIALSLLSLVTITAIVVGVLTSQSRAEGSSATNKATVPQSDFVFATEKAEGWRQGPSNATSMALFSNNHTCFTSIEYKKGNVNAVSELQKIDTELINSGYRVTHASAVKTSVQIGLDKITYDLHQHKVSGAGDTGKLYGGQEFGYIPILKGYLFVQGHCDTVDQLSSTIPALQAITVKDRK